ncbi:retrovirus-related pol polyprotein from transposon TNT 1-94 [Tanacetum coccineum]
MMNSMSLNGESVNMERKRNESCDKIFNLDAKLLKSQNTHNDLLKSYSQLEKHCISLELSIQLNQEIFQKHEFCDSQNALEIPEFFENNDLKALLQDKDITICKLKEIIKSMREKSKEENVNYDYCEIETKNVELENSVAKLLSENERLCKEINHVKQEAFLNDILREEVYVSQPDGFVNQDNPNHVYKLKKALSGLKQAPHAWYDLLSKFLLSQEFSKGTVDPTLFIRRQGKDILLISQSPRGIFINQSKYALESLKKYGMKSSDPVDTPMVEKSKLDEDTQGKSLTLYTIAKPTEKHLHAVKRIFKYLRGTINRGLWYPKDSSFALTAYVNADHAGFQYTRRSTSGKQVENGVVELYFVNTEYQLADIFTKALGRERIEFLINKLGIFDTSAGNPVKEILLKLNLPDHRILKDGGEVKEFQERCLIQAFKTKKQQQYEHVGPKVTSSQDGEKRLCLVDDLKMLKIT